MTQRIIAILLIGTFLLTSCGAVAPVEKTKEVKKPFLIDTKFAKDFEKNYTVEKSGRVVGSSTISLASQGVGRVSSITVKEGASVKKGQVLVYLTDTTAHYDIKLDQSNNGLKNTEVSAESTRLALDKTIADMKFALEKAKSDYNAVQEDSAKKLEKAVRDVNKSIVNATGSDAKMTLEKSQLDYQNLKDSNVQTIKNLDATYKLSYNELKKLFAKLLYQGDKSFGITDKYRNENITLRQYMGVRDSSARTKLEIAYAELQKGSNELDTQSMTIIDESNVTPELQKLGGHYGMIRSYLLSAQGYIENSISSSSFPQSTIDGYTAEYLGYKTELAGIETGYTSFKNSTATFLANYKNNEASVAAGIEVQKKTFATGEFESTLGLDRTKIGIDRDIALAKIAMDSAEANYNNAISNKAITLKKLEVSLTDARLSLEQAQKEFGKLSIVSPIDATVTKVNVSIGQEVTTGIPMIEIASRNPEIIFDLDSMSVSLLKTGSTQSVFYDGEVYSGTVVGVSQVANDSLLYSARLTLPTSPKYLGGVATIKLSLSSDYVMLPNEVVKIVSEEQGELSVFSGGLIVPMSVKLGSVMNRSIEILTPLQDGLEIITSDVSNFDGKKSIAEKRKVLNNPSLEK